MISRVRALAPVPYRVWMVLATLGLQAAVIVMTRSPAPAWSIHFHLSPGIHGHDLALVAAVLFVLSCVCGNLLAQFAVVKAPVHNLRNPVLLASRNLPDFIQQDRDSESLMRFRKNLNQILEISFPDSLAKAVAIRHWVRGQQSQDRRLWARSSRKNHENPHRLLEEQRKGVPEACRRFSYILLGSLLSAGLDARIVCFTSSLRRPGLKSHVAVEVWIEELAQWVLLDPTYDTLVLVDGKLASALQLHDEIVSGRLDRISFERHGATAGPHPRGQCYTRYCRHLFVAMSNAVFDGYSVRLLGAKRIHFLHYSREAAYPVRRRRLLLHLAGSGFCLSLILWAWTLFSLTRG